MSDEEFEGVVLVVGGSGYLGLHLMHYFATSTRFRLAFTYSKSDSPPPAPFLQQVPSFRVDLSTGAGLKEISDALGPSVAAMTNHSHLKVRHLSTQFTQSQTRQLQDTEDHGASVVSLDPENPLQAAKGYLYFSDEHIHAIAVPRECEENPELADAVNVPRSIVQWLKSFAHNKPLLIHLSTDQVYAGTKSFYKEEDDTKPVNVYGRTKVDAEKLIRANWPNYAILRSSIIYGPQPAFPVPKTLPIQWIDAILASGSKTDFFSDEFRCPVYVNDVVKVVVLVMLSLIAEGGFSQVLLNVGGPDRLSRAGMAAVVAQVRGHDLALINHVSASTVNRGVKSPPDISMNISRVTSVLGMPMTRFLDGVKETFSCSERKGTEKFEDAVPELQGGVKETVEDAEPELPVKENVDDTGPEVPVTETIDVESEFPKE